MEREKNDILYLVVPCYNEQEVLPETSKRLKEKMESLMERNMISRDSRIMFVNDGSKDRTWSMIEGTPPSSCIRSSVFSTTAFAFLFSFDNAVFDA